MTRRTRIIGNVILITAACVAVIGGSLWLAFRPEVADHFGYALPLDNRLPARISYRGRHYWDVWPCGGSSSCASSAPTCISKRALMNRDPRRLVQVGSIPTLFGEAHPLLGLPGPGAAVLLFASVHSCYVTYSLSGGP
jgi:hypothetical protein